MVDEARRMAREIAELKEAVYALQTSARLGYTAIDDGALLVKDEAGVVRQRIGRQTDGAFTVIDRDGITPPQPAAPLVIAGPISLNVSSYGNTVDNSAWPSDFAAIEVHVSTSPGFTPSAATKVGEFTTGGGTQVIRGESTVTLYVVLVGRNTSGVLGPASAEVSATPDAVVSVAELAEIEAAVGGLDSRLADAESDVNDAKAAVAGVQFEVNDATTIAKGKNAITYSTVAPVDEENTAGDLWFVISGSEIVGHYEGAGGTTWEQRTLADAVIANLDAGKIITGILDAARIGAGSIDTAHLAALAVTADKVATNAITAEKIAAGAVETGSLAADAITGMTITGGLFRTAVSGSRIVIAPDVSPSGRDAIQIYADHALQSQPAQLTVEEYGAGTTIEGNFLSITAGEWTDQTHTTPQITLKTERRNDGAGNPTEFRSINSHYAALHYFEGDLELWGELRVNGNVLDDTGWIAPTLLNGWVNYGGAFVGAKYRLLNGVVHIEGLIKSGAGVAFVLPVGYRPSGTLLLPSVDGTNTANGRIDIDANGNVLIANANNAFVSLHCSFIAEQ